MGTNKKAPTIRFKGFEGEWEDRKLGEIASVAMNKRIFKHQTAEKGEIPFFKIGTFGGEPDAFISKSLFEDYKSKYHYPTKGDILISASGSIGKTVEYLGADEYFQDSNIVWLKHDSKTVLNEYLKNFYSIVKWDGLEGSTIKRLYNNNILRTLISLPQLQEQTQIGTYFKELDSLIQQQEQKLEKVTNLKKAMLEKMFPKEGDDVPEIRFKGFVQNWEKKELLKYILKIIDFRGRTPRKLGLKWSNEGCLALSALNVRSGFIDKSIDAHYGDEILYNLWMNGNELHKGQVIFTTEAPMGNVARVPDNEKYILSQRVIAFDVDKNSMREDFLSVLLSTPKSFESLTALSSGGTAKGVSQKSLSNFKVMAPEDLKEQQKIGMYFQNLDQLINQSQQKIQQLKHLKQALLQKMFI